MLTPDLAPFRIDPPVQVSFSGGRTSGLMLRLFLDAWGGNLPEGYHVLFYNTGKEREETLQFVRECGERWNVPIVWLEYDRVRDELGGWHNTYRTVDFGTASRNGEPFDKLIVGRSYLPNVVTRFCTTEMKVRTGKRYLINRGVENWTCAVGIRADEPKRLGNRSDPRERWTRVHPLADAGVYLEDVQAFWSAQPFDLGLRPDEGNCDLCFLKGRGKLLRLIKERPASADWWLAREREMKAKAPSPELAQFNRRRSYEQLVETTRGGPLFCGVPDDEVEDCNCTD